MSQTETPATPRHPLDRLAQAATAVAALALVGLVIVQGWQVFARYVINDSPSWTEPVTVLLLSTAMSLAAAAGVRTGRHFSFVLLAEALGPAARRAMAAATGWWSPRSAPAWQSARACCGWTAWTCAWPAHRCRRAAPTCRCAWAVR